MTHIGGVYVFISDIGFEVPDAFLVGYALDYNEYFRDLSVSLLQLITSDGTYKNRHLMKQHVFKLQATFLIVYSIYSILIVFGCSKTQATFCTDSK